MNILVRVRAEAVGGIAQIGIGRIKEAPAGGCGLNGNIKVFWEYKKIGGNYTCGYGTATVPQSGTFVVEPLVMRINGASSTSWQAYFNGSAVMTFFALGFETATYQAGTGGEIFHGDDTGYDVDVTIGTGSIPWQRTADNTGPHSWTTINNHSGFYQQGNWQVQETVHDPASPFTLVYP